MSTFLHLKPSGTACIQFPVTPPPDPPGFLRNLCPCLPLFAFPKRRRHRHLSPLPLLARPTVRLCWSQLCIKFKGLTTTSCLSVSQNRTHKYTSPSKLGNASPSPCLAVRLTPEPHPYNTPSMSAQKLYLVTGANGESPSFSLARPTKESRALTPLAFAPP